VAGGSERQVSRRREGCFAQTPASVESYDSNIFFLSASELRQGFQARLLHACLHAKEEGLLVSIDGPSGVTKPSLAQGEEASPRCGVTRIAHG